jgi:hypothetical protein
MKMTLPKMEKIKFAVDIGVTVFGLLAAVFAVLSLIYSSKLDYAKKIEEERLKSKIAASNAIAEKAKEEAANALSSAANTNEKAKKLELQVEIQKERAANAEKNLLILQEQVKPRSIPADKSKELIDSLKNSNFKEIMISSSLGEGEAATYANKFKYIFETAGWKVDSGIGFSTFTGTGIYIIVKDNRDQEALWLQKTFSKFGINFKGQVMPEGTKIQLFIGSKNVREGGIE